MTVPSNEPNATKTKISKTALLGELGLLKTRLANSEYEKRVAQRLRHQVFCEEYAAKKSDASSVSNHEGDEHDAFCDHLIVYEQSDKETPIYAGTQRFMVRKGDSSAPTFYSQSEFNIETLAQNHPDLVFMELGRSCILPEYRTKRTMELMWQGTWAYAIQNNVDVMIGCASFHETDFNCIRQELEFLAFISPTSAEWDVQAIASKCFSIERRELSSSDQRNRLRKLPPLIKGYLRLGAMFSTQAVLDEEFGTIDVMVVLPVEQISERYIRYYGAEAQKHRPKTLA